MAQDLAQLGEVLRCGLEGTVRIGLGTLLKSATGAERCLFAKQQQCDSLGVGEVCVCVCVCDR